MGWLAGEGNAGVGEAQSCLPKNWWTSSARQSLSLLKLLRLLEFRIVLQPRPIANHRMKPRWLVCNCG